MDEVILAVEEVFRQRSVKSVVRKNGAVVFAEKVKQYAFLVKRELSVGGAFEVLPMS